MTTTDEKQELTLNDILKTLRNVAKTCNSGDFPITLNGQKIHTIAVNVITANAKVIKGNIITNN